jgi:Uncharacterized protein conserved in bacteria (DUF2325)
MRIGIVGGLDRNAPALQALATARGHALELHTGVVAGPAAAKGLRTLVQRVDLVIVLTDVNSHNAVKTARVEARRWHRPLRLVRRLGPSQFSAWLGALPQERAEAA